MSCVRPIPGRPVVASLCGSNAIDARYSSSEASSAESAVDPRERLGECVPREERLRRERHRRQRLGHERGLRERCRLPKDDQVAL